MRLWLDLVFACSRLEETVGRGSHQRSHCALKPHTNTDTNTDTNPDTNPDTNTDENADTNTDTNTLKMMLTWRLW